MPIELWPSAGTGAGAAESCAGAEDMGFIVGEEELESVLEGIDGAEDRSRLECVKREAESVLQLAAKRRLEGRFKAYP